MGALPSSGNFQQYVLPSSTSSSSNGLNLLLDGEAQNNVNDAQPEHSRARAVSEQASGMGTGSAQGPRTISESSPSSNGIGGLPGVKSLGGPPSFPRTGAATATAQPAAGMFWGIGRK